jgi:hypothetical protein
MSKVLTSLVNKAMQRLNERARFFGSPGTVGRVRSRLVLKDNFAQELGDVKPGGFVTLSVRAEVKGAPTLGQRPIYDLEVVDVRRVR